MQSITLKLFVSRSTNQWVIDTDKVEFTNCVTSSTSTMVQVKADGYLNFKNTNDLQEDLFNSIGTNTKSFTCRFRVKNPGTIFNKNFELIIFYIDEKVTTNAVKKLTLSLPISNEVGTNLRVNTWYKYVLTNKAGNLTFSLYDNTNNIVLSSTEVIIGDDITTDPVEEDYSKVIEVDLMNTGYMIDGEWVWRAVKEVETNLE